MRANVRDTIHPLPVARHHRRLHRHHLHRRASNDGPDQSTTTWDAYFGADFRYRYFLALKDRFASRIKFLGMLIAILSCGPLINVFWQLGFGDVLSGVTGASAGLLGVYLGVSDLPRTLATAIRAATEWGDATRKLRNLWTRYERGEDVWAEYLELDDELTKVDAAAIEDLQRDHKLENAAWEEARAAHAAA